MIRSFTRAAALAVSLLGAGLTTILPARSEPSATGSQSWEKDARHSDIKSDWLAGTAQSLFLSLQLASDHHLLKQPLPATLIKDLQNFGTILGCDTYKDVPEMAELCDKPADIRDGIMGPVTSFFAISGLLVHNPKGLFSLRPEFLDYLLDPPNNDKRIDLGTYFQARLRSAYAEAMLEKLNSIVELIAHSRIVPDTEKGTYPVPAPLKSLYDDVKARQLADTALSDREAVSLHFDAVLFNKDSLFKHSHLARTSDAEALRSSFLDKMVKAVEIARYIEAKNKAMDLDRRLDIYKMHLSPDGQIEILASAPQSLPGTRLRLG